ncbi:MAG TPA: EF-hand domain-containing protein [Gammaproteobacteria bacterium]|nr:EF-hand domain-containing protein [Gammaproteobacteria bacterium]
MKKTLLAVSLAVAMCAMGTASAAGGFMPWSNMMKDIWKAYDKNGDGKLSMEEMEEMDHVLGQDVPGFAPWFKDHFSDLDANHDGVVDKKELHNMMVKMSWTDKDMVNGWYKNTGFMPLNPANKQ